MIYDTHVIHTDSLSSLTWTTPPYQNSYTSFLSRPLKNVVQVAVISASFDTASSNVIYLCSPELRTFYNQMTGVTSNTFVSMEPTTKSTLDGALLRINRIGTGRTEYQYQHFPSESSYMTPISRVDRITTELRDQNGVLAQTNTNVFVTYKLTSIREL